MDELTSYLISDRRQARIAPETLELMGKQAAAMFLTDGTPLTSAVVKVASEREDINPEQVKRVCEFANTAAYLSHHEKAKVAGANASYPQFELADPTKAISGLGSRAVTKVASPVASDFLAAPRKAKVASAEADSHIGSMFGAREQDVTFTRNTAVAEIFAAKDQLIGLKEHLEHDAQKVAMAYHDASESYYSAVKEHLLDGGSFSNIVAAARIPGVEYEKIAETLSPVVERLMREKVASYETLRDQTQGFEKVAHRIVNEQHPLSANFKAVVATGAEAEKLALSLADVDEQLNAVNSFIKETFHARAAR